MQELQTPYRIIGYPSKNPDSGRELELDYYFPFLLPISVNSSQQQFTGLEAAYVLLDHIMPFGILEATPKGTYLDYGIMKVLFDGETGYLLSFTSKELNLSYMHQS